MPSTRRLKVRTPQAALGWALALVTFPYFAIPLYWIFGRAKFIGYRRAATDEIGPLRSVAQKAAAAVEPFAIDSGATDGLERWRKPVDHASSHARQSRPIAGGW